MNFFWMTFLLSSVLQTQWTFSWIPSVQSRNYNENLTSQSTQNLHVDFHINRAYFIKMFVSTLFFHSFGLKSMTLYTSVSRVQPSVVHRSKKREGDRLNLVTGSRRSTVTSINLCQTKLRISWSCEEEIFKRFIDPFNPILLRFYVLLSSYLR